MGSAVVREAFPFGQGEQRGQESCGEVVGQTAWQVDFSGSWILLEITEPLCTHEEVGQPFMLQTPGGAGGVLGGGWGRQETHWLFRQRADAG